MERKLPSLPPFIIAPRISWLLFLIGFITRSEEAQ